MRSVARRKGESLLGISLEKACFRTYIMDELSQTLSFLVAAVYPAYAAEMTWEEIAVSS
jgi:hypothetical protein